MAAAPATAATLDYQATLDLHVATVAPFQLQASGQISVNPDGSFVLPAGVFATTRTLVPPQTPSEAVASIDFQIANAEGSFGGPASPGGVMSLNGQAVLNLQPSLGFSPVTLALSPLGATGTATGMASNGVLAVTATLTGAPWQTGVFQQRGTTVSGSTFTIRTNTGADLRTASGEGVVSLVVPAYVTTRLDGGFSDRSPVTAVLEITFAPEPAQLVGQVAVIAALLGIAGRRTAEGRRRARAEREAR